MTNLMMAADPIEDLARISSSLDTVLKTSVLSLFCTLFVLITGATTKRVGPTFIAIIAAGAIWWSVMNMVVFREKAGEAINEDALAPPAAVLVHDAPVRGSL